MFRCKLERMAPLLCADLKALTQSRRHKAIVPPRFLQLWTAAARRQRLRFSESMLEVRYIDLVIETFPKENKLITLTH